MLHVGSSTPISLSKAICIESARRSLCDRIPVVARRSYDLLQDFPRMVPSPRLVSNNHGKNFVMIDCRTPKWRSRHYLLDGTNMLHLKSCEVGSAIKTGCLGITGSPAAERLGVETRMLGANSLRSLSVIINAVHLLFVQEVGGLCDANCPPRFTLVRAWSAVHEDLS